MRSGKKQEEWLKKGTWLNEGKTPINRRSQKGLFPIVDSSGFTTRLLGIQGWHVRMNNAMMAEYCYFQELHGDCSAGKKRILAYFVYWITNAISEGINDKDKVINCR